jgi:zinc/manganese transport system substrate-binding protein
MMQMTCKKWSGVDANLMQKQMRLLLNRILGRVGLLFVLFGGLSASLAKEEVQVVALHPLLGELAEQIGGDHVEVTNLLAPGEDPHLFQPRPEDVKRVSQADLILAGGLGLEPYLDQLRGGAGSKAGWLLVGDKLPEPLEGEHVCGAHDHDHDHGSEFDPHWWHSVANMKHAAELVNEELGKLLPQSREELTGRTEAVIDQLDELEQWVRREVARLPRERRVLVTSHQAFAYLGHDYGFTILPLVGLSTTDQPSSQGVRELIGTLREKQVRALFAEDRENSRVLEQILQETGAKLGGVLYADGPGDNGASTYDAMMRYNISTIVGALQ